MGIAEGAGWLAAAMTLLTFVSGDMRRLRLTALAANAAFIAYGLMAGLSPVLMLHLLLVPINAYRLFETCRLQSIELAEQPEALAPPRQWATLSRRVGTPRRVAMLSIPGHGRPPCRGVRRTVSS